LNVGGRLILPLTPGEGFGVMLKVTRTGENAFTAAVLMRVAFIPCVGARDEASAISLASALEQQPLKAVRSLRRGVPPDSTAWCVGSGWWLSTADSLP